MAGTGINPGPQLGPSADARFDGPRGKSIDKVPGTGDNLAVKLKSQWHEGRAWTDPFRIDSREDRMFYHNVQWSEKQERELLAQGKPPTQINMVAKAINNLSGRQRDMRWSWKVHPRVNRIGLAETMTKGLLFHADANEYRFQESDLFKNAALGPFACMEVGWDDRNPAECPLFLSQVDWTEIYWDPFYRKHRPMRESRYVIRIKWTDLDLAKAAYPKAAEALANAVEIENDYQQQLAKQYRKYDDYGNRGGGPTQYNLYGEPEWLDKDRQRVRLREHWWWEWVKTDDLVKPDGETLPYDKQDPRFVEFATTPGVRRHQGMKRQFKWAVAAGDVVLDHGDSPYPFEDYPFEFLWCFMDDEGNPYGLVRNMRDPQKELNTARSRFNEAIRSRHLFYKKGAFGKMTQAQVSKMLAQASFAQEVQTDPNASLQFGSDKADTELWAKLMEMSKQEIDDAVGLGPASYGDQGNERTAVAIRARVGQQGLNYGELFDNLRHFRVRLGQKMVAIMAKFCTPEYMARIVAAQTLKDGEQPDLSWIQNTLSGTDWQLDFDVVMDDQAETITERDAIMQQAINIAQMGGPELQQMMMPYIVRMSDFPDKEEFAQALEQKSQQPPPPPPPPKITITGQQLPPDALQAAIEQAGLPPSQYLPQPGQQGPQGGPPQGPPPPPAPPRPAPRPLAAMGRPPVEPGGPPPPFPVPH